MGTKKKYDFSMYKQDESSNKPKMSYLRSKYANWEGMLKIYNDLRESASIHASELEYTQEIQSIKKLCGFLGEIWDIISYMQGSVNQDTVSILRSECWNLINQQRTTKQITDNLRSKVIEYKNKIYNSCWHVNLGFDVEKINKGSRAKSLIVNN